MKSYTFNPSVWITFLSSAGLKGVKWKKWEWETCLVSGWRLNRSCLSLGLSRKPPMNECKQRQDRGRKSADLPLDTITDEEKETSPFSFLFSFFTPFPLSFNHIDLYLNAVIPWWFLYYSSSSFFPFPDEVRLNLCHLSFMNKRKGPVNSRPWWRTTQKEMIRDREWRTYRSVEMDWAQGHQALLLKHI